jgi:hypothetical protein
MFSADSRTDHIATFVRRNKKFIDKAESKKQKAPPQNYGLFGIFGPPLVKMVRIILSCLESC